MSMLKKLQSYRATWVITQALLFLLLIFIPAKSLYQLPASVMFGLYGLQSIAVIIALIALYHLRHSFSVSPQPVKNAHFQYSGIYHYVRHPMYTSVILLFLAITLKAASWLHALLFLLLITFLIIKTNYEETLLRATYQDYATYEKKVGRFFPKVFSKNK